MSAPHKDHWLERNWYWLVVLFALVCVYFLDSFRPQGRSGIPQNAVKGVVVCSLSYPAHLEAVPSFKQLA